MLEGPMETSGSLAAVTPSLLWGGAPPRIHPIPYFSTVKPM